MFCPLAENQRAGGTERHRAGALRAERDVRGGEQQGKSAGAHDDCRRHGSDHPGRRTDAVRAGHAQEHAEPQPHQRHRAARGSDQHGRRSPRAGGRGIQAIAQGVGADDSLRASCVVGSKGAVGRVRQAGSERVLGCGLRPPNPARNCATPSRHSSRRPKVPEPTANQEEFYRSTTENYNQLLQSLSQYGDTSVHFCRIKTRLVHAPPSSTSIVVQTPSVGRH